jgi:hypothetical protein
VRHWPIANIAYAARPAIILYLTDKSKPYIVYSNQPCLRYQLLHWSVYFSASDAVSQLIAANANIIHLLSTGTWFSPAKSITNSGDKLTKIWPVTETYNNRPWHRRSFAGLSYRRPRFEPRPFHEKFVVHTVALTVVFLRLHKSPPLVSPHLYPKCIPLSPKLHNLNKWERCEINQWMAQNDSANTRIWVRVRTCKQLHTNG